MTKFQADPTLVGKWTAEVPRNTATLQARLQKEGIGIFSVDLRTSGQAFDDSANQFKLDGYAQVDLYAEHGFGRRWQIYSSVQNLFDSEVQAGRTPLLTLGAPRIVEGGIALNDGTDGSECVSSATVWVVSRRVRRMRRRAVSRPVGSYHSCRVWMPPPMPPVPMAIAGMPRERGMLASVEPRRGFGAEGEVAVDGAEGVEEG